MTRPWLLSQRPPSPRLQREAPPSSRHAAVILILLFGRPSPGLRGTGPSLAQNLASLLLWSRLLQLPSLHEYGCRDVIGPPAAAGQTPGGTDGPGDVDRCTPSAALKVLDPSRLWSRAPLVSGDFPQMFLVCLTACQSSSDLKRSPPPDEFSLSVLSLL
ncbi:unnamed protein product [Arctogadus glacialis]